MSIRLTERAWCVVIPHHPLGARIARRRLSTELSTILHPTELADVVTVLAELVGNAIRHAEPLPGGVVRAAWRLRPAPPRQLIQVRVTDGGAPEYPRLRTVELDSCDGRGLTIVAALAERWGVDRDGLGQSVWAELSLATPPQQVVSRSLGRSRRRTAVGPRPAEQGPLRII